MKPAHDPRDRYLARRDAGVTVDIVTPEGIPLHWTIAAAGDRITAFTIDAAIMLGAIVVIVTLAVWGLGLSGMGSWIGVFVQLALFLLGNFYFTVFEMKWHGQTPGKRAVGIRVVDAHGGPLTAEAVLGRNLLRQIEIFIPIGLISAPESLWPGAPGWGRALCFVWLIVFALMPVWNRHRCRIGDLVAGTIVVLTPRALLLEDIGQRSTATPAASYAFTREMLDVYGIYELQVLEDLLREHEAGRGNPESMGLVCEKIKKKIAWPTADWEVNHERFLMQFYAALRVRLEHKLLFGKRQEDKFSR